MAKVTLEERIAVRAYYVWLNGSDDTLDNWFGAEIIEQMAARARSDAAKKGAMTRRMKSDAILRMGIDD